MSLTPQQLKIGQLVSKGWTTKAISGHMAISTHCVKAQLCQIYDRLGLNKSKDLYPRVLLANFMKDNEGVLDVQS